MGLVQDGILKLKAHLLAMLNNGEQKQLCREDFSMGSEYYVPSAIITRAW